jgi:malate permease and related proteins
METFIFAINAIFPIVLLIGLGYMLKKIEFYDDYFLNTLNKYVFRVGLPILLFYNVYNIPSLNDIDWIIILFSVFGLLAVFSLGVLITPLIIKNDTQKGVFHQALFRSNFAIIGLPLASALGGIEALAVVSLIAAFAIPTMNLLSVIALTMYQKDEFGHRISFKKMVIKIIKNPLIIGVFLGLIVIGLRGFIPRNVDGELMFSLKNQIKFMYEAIRWIALSASPMALIALGGQFDFKTGKASYKEISIGVLLRTVILPAIILGLAITISKVHPNMAYAYPALISLFASPIAISSVVMAYELGGDHKLANQLVVWSTIASILTLFVIIIIFRYIGAF